MKPLHITTVFVLAAVLIAFGIHSNRSSAQQSSATDNDWGNSKFLVLESQLIKSGQTNLAAQVASAIGEFDDMKAFIEIDDYIQDLQYLQKGQTNEAINLMNSRINGILVGYSHIQHSRSMDEAVREVRKYRNQFPYKDSNPDIDEDISNSLHSVSP